MRKMKISSILIPAFAVAGVFVYNGETFGAVFGAFVTGMLIGFVLEYVWSKLFYKKCKDDNCEV